MTQKKRILIIDDHPLVREGLKTIIARSSKHEVIGEAGTGRQGLQMARELKPDLALLDMSLPDQSGIELIRDILKATPKTRIMIVSMHSKIDYIVKAFQAGASGYLVKESAAEMLMQGIDHVLKGDYFMDTSVSQQVVKKLVGMPPKESIVSVAGYDALTVREQEVMALLAEGLTTGQVADKLFISPKTAENHRSNIMRKLGLHSTVELIRYAAKLGLIDIDLWKE
ncbi:MAG: response regulator transcription factor [Pseudomonadota bacterium]|uniref:Response regulator transcription factor n=1 Tax=Candidatus Desulfatibia profunda TaxID=2841695 RepID=A0A8J6TJ93_9BACT|nr:response regulator transcription factor [Candidatus Desulfatibia profunda]